VAVRGARAAVYDAGSTDFDVGPRVDQRADGWTLSRKRVKSRLLGRKPRSTKTKASTHIVLSDESQTALIKKLKARARDLEKKFGEALEQQTATSAVLKVISSSPGELEPVFETMLGNSTRICKAKFGVLFRSEGDAFRAVSVHGTPSFVEERLRNPVLTAAPGTGLGRMVATGQPAQIADIREEPANNSVARALSGRFESAGFPKGYG